MWGHCYLLASSSAETEVQDRISGVQVLHVHGLAPV